MANFDARAVAAELDGRYQPFSFVGIDGDTYELPHPLTMLEREAERFNTNPKGYLRESHPDAHEAIEDMPVAVSRQLLEAWMGLQEEAGKSPAPSRATRRAVKPSKRTSQPAG